MEQKRYQWQEECLKQWNANGRYGLIQAVTGAGKTRLALTAAKQLLQEYQGDIHIKIVVPTGGLMRQWNRALRKMPDCFWNREMSEAEHSGMIGLRGAGHRDPEGRQYMIYVINSARYELAREILRELEAGERVFLIADECHHYESGQNRLIFEFMQYIGTAKERFFSMGLSATLPSGEAGRYLESVLGRRIYNYEMEQASAMHTVCDYDVYHVEVSFRDEEKSEYEEISERMQTLYKKLLKYHPELEDISQKERFETLRRLAGDQNKRISNTAALYLKLVYQRKSLVCLAAARCSCVCDLIRRLGIERKIIVFGERIPQAEELYRLLEIHYPGRVGRYHSQMGQQANCNTLERFQEGTIRILIACRAADEGIDLPDAEVGIILSGTSVKRQKIQRLGRVLRNQEDKEYASLYYLRISDSAEELCFLPNEKSRFVFEMEYMEREHRLVHPAYDKAAEQFQRNIGVQKMDEQMQREVKRCLWIGRVRSDWMLEKNVLEAKIRDAGNKQERNYWICMRKMADCRELLDYYAV